MELLQCGYVGSINGLIGYKGCMSASFRLYRIMVHLHKVCKSRLTLCGRYVRVVVVMVAPAAGRMWGCKLGSGILGSTPLTSMTDSWGIHQLPCCSWYGVGVNWRCQSWCITTFCVTFVLLFVLLFGQNYPTYICHTTGLFFINIGCEKTLY